MCYWLDDDKQGVESSEDSKDDDNTEDTVATNDVAFSEHEQEQQAYLEPILVAMELGQEILQGNTGDEEQTTVW